MTEYKKSIVFDEQEKSDAEPIELTAQHHFDVEVDKFVIADNQNLQDDDKLDLFSKPKSKKRSGWRALIFGGFALACWQTVDLMWSAFQEHDWLTLGWGCFVAGFVLIVMGSVVREFITMRRLNARQHERDNILNVMQADGIGRAKSICEKLAKQGSNDLALTVGYDKWQHALATTHNDKEVFELYELMVVKEQDIIVQKMIGKYAVDAAIMVSLSPLALADMVLVGWRNFRLIERISYVYGIDLSFWSKVKLVRLIFTNMALAGASEAIADIGLDLLSVDLAGRLSVRAAQGLGIGLLSAKLGYQAMALMRPLPYISCQKPKLSDMRKQLLGQLIKS